MIYNNLILNNSIFNTLIKANKINRLPHAVIFHGDDGIGKEAHAIEFAAYLNCNFKSKGYACGNCSNCIRIKSFQHGNVKLLVPMPSSKNSSKINSGSLHTLSKSQFDTYLKSLKSKSKNPYSKIDLNAKSIPIGLIRQLRKDLSMSSLDNGWKIVMIFDAEKLCTGNQAPANALLKILEEPPIKTLFILVTSRFSRLLETIKSRCQCFYFGNLPIDEIKNYLKFYEKKLEKINIISKMSEGNLGLALKLLNNYEIILKDLEMIINVYFKLKTNYFRIFQDRLLDLNRIGNRELFNIFFLLQIQLIRDIIFFKIDEESNHIIFKNFKTEYVMIIKKYPNADFYSMINMVDGAYAYEQANVNLSLNALGLIFDMHSCLKIDNTKLFNH